MRKIITVNLWVDNDWCKGEDKHYMDDNLIRQDIEQELSCCWHNFEIIKFETMEIHNERCTADEHYCVSGTGAARNAG